MNTNEFDKLMVGKDAKWADSLKLQSLSDLMRPPHETMKIENNPDFGEKGFKSTLIPAEDKAKIKAEIKEKQEPIPLHISREIHKYVKDQRAKGESERSIRRAVKRKWNIFVI